METLIQEHLINSGVDESDLKNKIVPHLWEKGFKKVADFEFLESQDLDDLDVNDVIKRRLWKFIHAGDQSITIKSESNGDSNQDAEIYIRYIFCNCDLFANDITEMRLRDIKPSMKLKDITKKIHSENKIPQEETIELYSSHGYPLQNNEITGEGTLRHWKIDDGDLFYVLRRLKEQPQMKEFVSLPEVDHNIGQETFVIETPFHGSFPVNAYMDCDSPEDIAQKVYNVTELQVPFMSLYVRRGYEHQRMTAFTELKDRDHIRVVLRNPLEIVQPHSIDYGSQNYHFLVPQTPKGITKFFSILKLICSPQPYNKEYDFEKFLSYLMILTDFPPLVYALQNLKEFSFLTISSWTALIEGFYLLFKTILDFFAKVSKDEIFEYSDYIFSIFIQKSHNIEETCTETQQCSLVCPLSGTRIHQPVRVDVDMTQGPFDKENILAKIESDNDFGQFGGKLTKEQIKRDIETAKLLMYFPWETDKKACVWTNPPKYVKPPKICKKVEVSFKWYDMLNSLKELHILNPQGLYSGDECLTYNSEAHLIYFLGSTKSTDEKRRFYNACADVESSYQQVIHKSELETIGNSGLEMQVTSDIWKVINKDTEEIQNYDEIRKSAVISPKESIQWETEEAIVKHRMGNMTRIDAAKQLFNSFATRTQAYKLHHALGLTIFGSEVTVKLKLTNNTEEFETSLKDIGIKGSTELTAAVVNAVQQLRQFNCKRRIMCLTDGHNTSRTTYETALSSAKEANVIVDTVLLTFPGDNNEQKAFSHATGGVCVLPKTMQEALRYFELDAMLSLSERVSRQFSTDLSVLKDTTNYPYETETSFKSIYIEAFHKVKTQSIKSHIDQLKETPSNSQQRRILRELREFMHNPHHSIAVYPSQNNYEKWKVLMTAPEESAYAGGVFALSVEFPKKYPFTQPEIRFLTPIYHCNVSSSSGRICHAILGESYTPSISMREILSYIYGLLMCPDIDTPLD
uniref:UBC core domain-containing protein n=1 Tax=Amphimedon queenslandica TaxID=400682 RepID=A0A1X7TLJ7_AMPQE